MWPTPKTPFEQVAESDAAIQLLLFVDQLSAAAEQIQHVRNHLETLKSEDAYDLHVVEVAKHPYLVEYFKLVVTPALVKIHPEPRQVLAGSNLVTQLKECWPHWQDAIAVDASPQNPIAKANLKSSLALTVQLMQLSDEIFRLNQENEALQDQLQFKDRIIAMLAHDLRNPLTAAAIAVETLEGQWEPNPEALLTLDPEMLLRLAQHARTQIQVIDRMITNLLETSSSKSAELQIRPKQLNIGTLCEQVVADSLKGFKRKSQHLKTDIPPDLPWVHADADHIRQVMMNLLDNAGKYTPAGGLIQLSVLHRTTQKVEVRICDNGLGIPEENQQSIFEDTFRLDRDRDQSGYGIGLALCQRIIQAHYGQIWVESTPDHGSCFHFTLPVYRH